MNNIPDGYEPAGTSAAKDVTMAALEAALEKQGIDPHDGDRPIDLIALSDAAVEALLNEGATIPSGMASPFVPH